MSFPLSPGSERNRPLELMSHAPGFDIRGA